MKLKIIESDFSVLKYPANNSIPAWVTETGMFSITRTDEELSIVCPTQAVIKDDYILENEEDWSCIKIEGPLDFALIGILASIANPLAENQISIFALSTYNTDYLLVKKESIDKAKKVLEKEGHQFI